MLELKGKYNKDCKIFVDEIEETAISLIQNILDERATENVPVRIMPDVHAGKSIVIGFTMPLTNLLSPEWCGVDIGCGMLSAKFSGTYKLKLEQLDTQIRNAVPVGFNVHGETILKKLPFEDVQRTADLFTTKFNEKFGTDYVAPTYSEKWLESKLKDIKQDAEKFWKSIGTLGGGNHFIEVGKDSNSDFWVTVHTGSRNFGLKIADYWTNIAKGKVMVASKEYNKELNDIFENTVPKKLIPVKVKALKEKYGLGIDKMYLSDKNLIGYLYDMIFAQKYAGWNRDTILSLIKDKLKIKEFDEVISTIHNYIDFNDFIIRKGAISSYKGDKMIIPFNMRDGILLCEGKSNEDWNFSAPHGAGRVMSRSKAKEAVNLDAFKETMKGIYSTSVNKNTLDESPFAYKKSEMIEKAIEPTATILDRIKPILNIKDSGKSESWKERKKRMKKRNK